MKKITPDQAIQEITFEYAHAEPNSPKRTVSPEEFIKRVGEIIGKVDHLDLDPTAPQSDTCPGCGLLGGCQCDSECVFDGEVPHMASKDVIDRLHRIWDILVKHAGASEEVRQNFIAVAEDYTSRTLEFRFQGALGFGGKVWLNNGPHVYVNGYQEDYTPEIQDMILATDEALKEVK